MNQGIDCESRRNETTIRPMEPHMEPRTSLSSNSSWYQSHQSSLGREWGAKIDQQISTEHEESIEDAQREISNPEEATPSQACLPLTQSRTEAAPSQKPISLPIPIRPSLISNPSYPSTNSPLSFPPELTIISRSRHSSPTSTPPLWAPQSSSPFPSVAPSISQASVYTDATGNNRPPTPQPSSVILKRSDSAGKGPHDLPQTHFQHDPSRELGSSYSPTDDDHDQKVFYRLREQGRDQSMSEIDIWRRTVMRTRNSNLETRSLERFKDQNSDLESGDDAADEAEEVNARLGTVSDPTPLLGQEETDHKLPTPLRNLKLFISTSVCFNTIILYASIPTTFSFKSLPGWIVALLECYLIGKISL
ncbi:hypothetical protein BT69DRAFT_1315200, partial [Atractiella rhizophila]